jgi:DHA2 family multidrug resistance protein
LVIAVTVVLGAMLEVICRNAVGITLPFIQGNLMATAGEIGWVLAGYSVAAVAIIPLVAWLDGRVSGKTCFLGSLCVFTLGSMLCGLAPTPSVLILARVLQGLGGGAILASGQSILVQNFSQKRAQGVAQTAFVLMAFLGTLIGPVLGVYLTDNYGWRLPFHLSVPFEFVALILVAIFLPRDATPCGPRTAGDGIGLLFMIIGMASLQVILERGPIDHWFASHLITAMAVTCLLSTVAFVGWELRVERPLVELRALCFPSGASGSLYPILLGAGLFIAFYILPDFAGGNSHATAIHTGEWLILVRWALVSPRSSNLSSAEPASARRA